MRLWARARQQDLGGVSVGARQDWPLLATLKSTSQPHFISPGPSVVTPSWTPPQHTFLPAAQAQVPCHTLVGELSQVSQESQVLSYSEPSSHLT